MAKLFCKILFLGCFLAAGTLLGQSKITPSLDDRIGAAMENGEMVEALVFLADQFDIRALDRQLYREKASPRERAYRVITALQSKAQETQPILMTFLENQAALGLEAVERYWIANILVIRANPALIYALSERDEVEFLDIVHKPQIEDGYPDPEQPDSPMIPGGSELGLRLVKADSMWALGYDGTGRLVMNYDSGVDGNHPALAGRWLGLRVPTDQAWNGAGNFPADGNGHGTHTMGTITGMSPSTSDTVGMAPGAEWIAADFDVSIVGAFQWAMNPDGDPNTIADMPDVVSNSWGVDPTGGCLTNTYGNILSAVEASGIAVVFSAGNSGPGTQTITGPKNINIDLVNTFATANLRGADPSLPYNAGSSRGPSGCGGSGPLLIKPEAGAPGTSVRSSIPGGGYANFTGTSMACPHVAGAVTLLKQALPDRTGHELKMALYLTARETPADLAGNDPGEPIGEESGEDNNYGRGIIDVYAAFLSFASPAAPGNLVAYSDYRTPDGMSLTWENPTNLANGDTLLPGDYQVIIERDGVVVDSLPGGSNTYTDGGLNDGQAYSYAVHARTLANALNGESSQTRWICGGAPEPRGVSRFSLSGGTDGVSLSWENPVANIDGTPMDDLGGINLYQDGTLVSTFARTTADSGAADSALYTPQVSGLYAYYITVVDNEDPANESVSSEVLGTPLSLFDVHDEFEIPGEPDPVLWENRNAEVNDRADNPNGQYALNLNGSPDGGDSLTLHTVDLSLLNPGDGLVFMYAYQPQGTGNRPEPGDSLFLDFRDASGQWVNIHAYPGMENRPFEQVFIEMDTLANGAFYHSQFQARFTSIGSTGTLPNDDWFVDDVSFNLPVGIGDGDGGQTSRQFELKPNFPNPFNPGTSIAFVLPQKETVKLVIYNALGQEVRVLASRQMAAGLHTLQWDGKNESGEGVASGIYLYRLQAGQQTSVRKMLLVR